MIQVIASIIDPLGFMEPFVIWARLILQKVLQIVKSWDSKDVPAEFLTEFGYGYSNASGRGYGAVYYVRYESKDGDLHVSIICAKSHMVPLKDVEACHMDLTPRLELQVVRLSARMRASIIEETGNYHEVVMWTDSECVIKQLHDTETRFKVYFANRLSEIQALKDVAEWRWVPTHVNPADNCSKGMLAQDPNWGKFHNGPDYLWRDEEEWPAKKVVSCPFPAHILATTAEQKPALPASWVLRICEKVATWRDKDETRGAVQTDDHDLRRSTTMPGAVQRR